MKIAFKTFGCKTNSVDTDFLRSEAAARGFEVVAENQAADAYVINSCTVTHGADRDARHQIRRFRRLAPNSQIAVVGCYSQVSREELLAIPGVSVVGGTASKTEVLDFFTQSIEGKSPPRDQVQKPTGFLVDHFVGSRHARAPVKIQDGCNFSCSFCIIPQARGRSRSLPLGTVSRLVDEAYAQGFHEVVITGVHLAHYGWDQNTDLLSLLQQLLSKKDGPRLRLSTLDPFEIPDELISLLAEEPRLCPHLHIALQSGSNAVLSAMNRIYRAEQFIEVTEKISKKRPDSFIGVDMITGFPGETHSHFRESVAVLESSFWTKLHVFPYSVRRETKAEGLPQRVSHTETSERSREMIEMSEKRYSQFLDSQIGSFRKMIVEKQHHAQNMWSGHTENYVPIICELPNAKARALAPIRITERYGLTFGFACAL